jgi:hypothetical protein
MSNKPVGETEHLFFSSVNVCVLIADFFPIRNVYRDDYRERGVVEWIKEAGAAGQETVFMDG